MTKKIFFITLCFLSAGCREALVDSNDTRKETLIIGQWAFYNIESNSTINLVFNSNFSVHVVNTSNDNPVDETFLFRIEDNVLYFFNENEEFTFNIVELNALRLVLQFFSNQQTVTQTYTRVL